MLANRIIMSSGNKEVNFVAVADGGIILISTDGINWGQKVFPYAGYAISCVSYGNGLWVAAGEQGALATSPDGKVWTGVTSSFGTSQIFDVLYDSALGLWIAVGGNGKVATSPTGATWTQRTSNFGNYTIRCVSKALNTLRAAGYGTGGGGLSESTTGLTWSGGTGVFGTNIFSCEADKVSDYHLFGGSSDSLFKIVANGTLTTVSSPFAGSETIYALKFKNNLWVAGGGWSSSAYKISTCANPTTGGWIDRPTGLDNSQIVLSITYGKGLWVAVTGNNGIITSPNATTWTIRNSTMASGNINDVAFKE